MCVILIDRALVYESHANFWTTKKMNIENRDTLLRWTIYTYNVAKKTEYGGARDIHRCYIAVYTKRMCISDPKCDDVISMRFSVFVPLLFFFFSFITKHIGCATILIAMNNFYCFQIQNQNHIRKISKNSFCCNEYLPYTPNLYSFGRFRSIVINKQTAIMPNKLLFQFDEFFCKLWFNQIRTNIERKKTLNKHWN